MDEVQYSGGSTKKIRRLSGKIGERASYPSLFCENVCTELCTESKTLLEGGTFTLYGSPTKHIQSVVSAVFLRILPSPEEEAFKTFPDVEFPPQKSLYCLRLWLESIIMNFRRRIKVQAACGYEYRDLPFCDKINSFAFIVSRVFGRVAFNPSRITYNERGVNEKTHAITTSSLLNWEGGDLE